MRTLVHLSDLHFGRVDDTLLEPLIRRVKALQPNVVVVSGDLTQRARPREFRAARRFLDALPAPRIVVPGNHDVPLYNVLQRFLRPLDKYLRFITGDLEPVYVDTQIAVVGLNSARSLVFKGGRIDEAQVERVRERLCRLDGRMVKIVVTHHPFDLPPQTERGHIVGGAARAMKTFARCGADILLSGHLHFGHAGKPAADYRIEGYSPLVIQAGTATSTRGRGALNSFNVLRIGGGEVRVERLAWDVERGDFVPSGAQTFVRSPEGWAEA